MEKSSYSVIKFKIKSVLKHTDYQLGINIILQNQLSVGDAEILSRASAMFYWLLPINLVCGKVG